ncbi:MAG: transposase [Acidithiobacillus sp.]|nr:transposase [Acidithiobacillus sp.]
MLLLVDPAYTSQICPVCGVVDAGNRKVQAVFHCLHCGHEAHADVNAAQNILARGLRPAKGLHPAGGLQSTAGHAGVVCSPAQAGELPETKGNQAIEVAEVRPLLAERNPRPSRSQERQP